MILPQHSVSKWVLRRPCFHSALVAVILCFSITFLFTGARILHTQVGGWSHGSNGGTTTRVDVTNDHVMLEQKPSLLLRKWRNMVAEIPKPIEGNQTWVAEQVLLLKHYRDMWQFRQSLPLRTKGRQAVMAEMERDIKRVEHDAFSFMGDDSTDRRSAIDRLIGVAQMGTYKRGVVVVAGSGQYRFLCHLLASIRSVFKSNIPFEIFYRGPQDLTTEQQWNLTAFGNVILKDLLAVNIFNETEASLHDATFALKPFAVLASSFEEPILVDADVVFLQDPKNLYDDPGYKRTGTMFYHDRRYQSLKTRPWIKNQLNYTGQLPSPTLAASKWWNSDFHSHNQDSGVVLINKRRWDVVLSFTLTTWMNSKRQREILGKTFWGDKETFWTAFELVGQPYAFEEKFGGAAGKLEEGGKLMKVDNILHFDHELKPVWLNGGLEQSKHWKETPWLEVQTVSYDGEWRYAGPMWNYTNGVWVDAPEVGALVREMTQVAQAIDEEYHLKEPSS